MTSEKLLENDNPYLRFWARFRRKDGTVSFPAFCKNDFLRVFGEKVTRAMEDYLHFKSNPPSDEKTKHMQEQAIEILEDVGIDPVAFLASGKDERVVIEDP